VQTELTPAYSTSRAGRQAEAILRSCVHCGFCNATCPTYQLLGDELDGPRGRIYQIKQVLEGQTSTASLQRHLDRCLTCRACETTCPSGVQYHSLLDLGRELAEQHPRPLPQRLLRKLLIFGLSETRRFGALLGLARLVRPLMPQQLKKRIPKFARSARPDIGMHSRRMLLLDGCVQEAAAPHINHQAIRLFDQLGIALESSARAGCCGALQHHLADTAGARQRAKNNIDAWWPAVEAGVEAIVVTASGCAPTVKDYGVLLAEDADYAERAVRVGALARDISEVLCREDLSALGAGNGQRIAFHSPCSLQHGQQLDGVVEAMLQQAGFELVRVRDPHLCCGSAGTYSILQPQLAGRLRGDKLDALQAQQPEIIATANIGCLLHLHTDARVPVVHWIELLSGQADGRAAA